MNISQAEKENVFKHAHGYKQRADALVTWYVFHARRVLARWFETNPFMEPKFRAIHSPALTTGGLENDEFGLCRQIYWISGEGIEIWTEFEDENGEWHQFPVGFFLTRSFPVEAWKRY